MRAMAINPADRFASVGEMVEALAQSVAPHREEPAVSRAMAVYAEISTDDAALRESCSTALITGLRGLGFEIAVTAPDSLLAARSNPSRSLAMAVVNLVSDQCVKADIRIAIGLGNATFGNGSVDSELIDVVSWAPYPLTARVWIDPALPER
jgi:hypothetical protein